MTVKSAARNLNGVLIVPLFSPDKRGLASSTQQEVDHES